MLQVARLAPRILTDATPRVIAFLQEQMAPSGGAVDRSGKPDLYYTVFGLEGLFALGADLPVVPTRQFLATFADGDGLDLVHLACLARCWASLPANVRPAGLAPALVRRLARFRSRDGGYDRAEQAETGNVYGSFMGASAHEDLGLPIPEPDRLSASVLALRSDDGGFGGRPDLRRGVTTVTAAAITLLRQTGTPIPASARGFLWRQLHPAGGFLAIDEAPMPDLLSTATALHALVVAGEDLAPAKESCLDFVDSLWTGRAFCAHWADDTPDCEYAYYALLALGHLSVA